MRGKGRGMRRSSKRGFDAQGRSAKSEMRRGREGAITWEGFLK